MVKNLTNIIKNYKVVYNNIISELGVEYGEGCEYTILQILQNNQNNVPQCKQQLQNFGKNICCNNCGSMEEYNECGVKMLVSEVLQQIG